MNKGHIRLFFFVLSLFMYASNKVLANEASLVNDNINNPIQTKNNPGNKPVQKKTTPQDKPVHKKTTPQDKPVQKKTTPQDKSIQKKNTPQNTPVQANTPSQAKPAQANKPVQAQPAASNHSAQANKNVKKSGLSRLGRKISSILLSILEAFACGAPKPKKTGQNAPVRARNTPEKPAEKTTPEKPAEKITPEKPAEKTTTKNATIDINAFDALYKNNQHLLCHDPEEIEKVGKLMSGAAALLQKHLTSDDYYRTDFSREGTRILRRQKETDIGKFCVTIEHPDKYDEIKTTIWNPNGAQNMDPSFLTGQVVRLYGPNLMMIQQCYTSGGHSSVKYFHYLAHKVEVSKDKTIMVYLSTHTADINDSIEANMGALLDIAYSLEPGCDYEEEFKKNYVNLSGYDINKDDTKIDITYFDSIYDDEILAPLYGFKRVRSRKFAQLVNLKEKLTKKNRYIPNSTFLLD